MPKALTITLFCLFVATTSARAQAPLTITTSSLETCVVDQPCFLRLQAGGGSMPLQWRIAHGSLPPGLQLDAVNGIIAGAASAAGEYEFLIEVSDSSSPAQKASRLFTTKTIPPLTLEWKAPPVQQATTISGSVVVSNRGENVLDLTLIIVAVNEVGKAFALGYQHFDLPAKTTDQEIRFGAQLPGGRYTVRADAIAEVPARQRIYRAARQAGPFQLPVQ
jgi:hypothetical protein